LEPVRLQAAGRIDFQGVDADADPSFGPAASRSFVTGAVSLGAIYTPVESYALTVGLQYASRPPNAPELFANGPHLATAQFEIGDRDLSPQQSFSVDASIRKTAGPLTGSVGGFYNRFVDYIALLPNGETDPESDLPIFLYENIAAYFVGMEAEATLNVLDLEGSIRPPRRTTSRRRTSATIRRCPSFHPFGSASARSTPGKPWKPVSRCSVRSRSTACPKASARRRSLRHVCPPTVTRC
jgi:outer membrane receptor protein involved in Fe transport